MERDAVAPADPAREGKQENTPPKQEEDKKPKTMLKTLANISEKEGKTPANRANTPNRQKKCVTAEAFRRRKMMDY